ncbi:MAG: ATP-dependent sacrificial sulfur transferase LarE [Thermodesulfobacteriota bacterium]
MTTAAGTGIYEKLKRLEGILHGIDSLGVAFSGGVDSTFLLAFAKTVLNDKVIAVTSESKIHPDWEARDARKIARDLNVEHLRFHSNEMNLPDFLKNERNRCYVCKKALFATIREIVSGKGISSISHGANLDDLQDFRPGFKAAEEDRILSPLVDARLTKDEIRILSREMGLPNWNKPPMACLATRIPYGTPITREALERIGKAERFLLDAGFSICRVRYFGSRIRIEVHPNEVSRLLEDSFKNRAIRFFKRMDISEISVDLEGYSQGSMNQAERVIREVNLSGSPGQ